VVSAYPFALMLPQAETERLLEEHLERLGVSVERETALLSFSQDETAVTVKLTAATGNNETVPVDWLIGCDGAHSTVRHGLGMEFAGDTLASDWMLADVHVAGLKTPTNEMSIFWHSAGTLALFPISPERYRIVADIGPAKTEKRADPTLAEVQAVLDERGPGGTTVSDPIWLANFRINERMVKDYRSGRAFLAGDAAHVHSPAGGQGMNTGMQDASNLAWKLALVCNGLAKGAALLDSYSLERSTVAAAVLSDTGHLTSLATMHNPAMQFVRNHAASVMFGLAPVRRKFAENLTELTVHYPAGPMVREGSAAIDGPAAGQRAPIRSGEAGVGVGERPRFAIYTKHSANVTALLEKYSEILEPVARPPFTEGGLWLVRPDGYVGLATHADRLREADEYLASVVGDAASAAH